MLFGQSSGITDDTDFVISEISGDAVESKTFKKAFQFYIEFFLVMNDHLDRVS